MGSTSTCNVNALHHMCSSCLILLHLTRNVVPTKIEALHPIGSCPEVHSTLSLSASASSIRTWFAQHARRHDFFSLFIPQLWWRILLVSMKIWSYCIYSRIVANENVSRAVDGVWDFARVGFLSKGGSHRDMVGESEFSNTSCAKGFCGNLRASYNILKLLYQGKYLIDSESVHKRSMMHWDCLRQCW